MRSGHHSVIYWLLHQHQHAPVDTVCQENAGIVEIVSPYYNAIWFDNLSATHTTLNDRHNPLKAASYDRLALAYEYQRIEDISKMRYVNWDQFVQPDSDVYEVVILRDFLNTMSSHYGQNKAEPKRQKESALIWLDRAKAVLDGMRFINFNKYNCQVDYRHEVCEEFGLDFTDIGIDYITPFARGSSFTKLDKKAFDRTMLNKRYEQVNRKNLTIMSTREGQECLQISREIFGEV
jgi:hypothetical protein